jgi:hypothetical protein
MAISIHRRETNRLALYGLLLVLLIIGTTGPLLQTLDDDENLGITFIEVDIACHAGAGSSSHFTPVALWTGAEFHHLDLSIEHIVRSRKSSPLQCIALASHEIPLRR